MDATSSANAAPAAQPGASGATVRNTKEITAWWITFGVVTASIVLMLGALN